MKTYNFNNLESCHKFVLKHMPFLTKQKKTGQLHFPFKSLHDRDLCVEYVAQALHKQFSKSGENLHYYKCNKCGCKTVINGNSPANYVCVNSCSHRASGICGGSFSIEITEQEFKL